MKNNGRQLRFTEVAENLKVFRTFLGTIRDYKLPEWAKMNVAEAADLYTDGRETEAAQILQETEAGLRGALRSFFGNSPRHFRTLIDGLIADSDLERDIIDGLESGIRALEHALQHEQGTASFQNRIDAYLGMRDAIDRAPEVQKERDENLRRKKADELSRKQREKLARQQAEADRQRQIARERAEAERQVRAERAGELLANFR